MRISSSSSAAAAAAALLLACPAAPASAFLLLPPPPPSVVVGDGGRRRSSAGLRLRASSSSSTSTVTPSLADQLSSLSYDGSFLGIGRNAAFSKISDVAARGADAVASSPSSASSSSSPSPSSPSSFPDPGGLLSGAIDAIGSAASSASSSLASTYDAALASMRGYGSMVDSAPSGSHLAGGDAYWARVVGGDVGPAFGAAASAILRLLPDDVPPPVAILLASLLTYSVSSALLNLGGEPPPASPYPMNKYDPVSARRYFDGRWQLVIGRAAQIALLSSAFLSGLGIDYLTGNLKTNAQKRADELSVLLARLGPSFIKVGQSLSIRTDLLSPEYVRGLKALQDQCPPFDTADARRIIERELGGTIGGLFADFPAGPIAAASLGQVYRATIRAGGRGDLGGDDGDGDGGGGGGGSRVVAVKVQRPGIVEQIALDMHLIREVAGPLRRLFNLNTDIVGVVDAWGGGSSTSSITSRRP